MNMRAGLKLKGRKPRVAPSSATGKKATLYWRSRIMCMARNTHRMAATPAARPSSPSRKFTVLIMPMNQKMVRPQTMGAAKTIWWGKGVVGVFEGIADPLDEDHRSHRDQCREELGYVLDRCRSGNDLRPALRGKPRWCPARGQPGGPSHRVEARRQPALGQHDCQHHAAVKPG